MIKIIFCVMGLGVDTCEQHNDTETDGVLGEPSRRSATIASKNHDTQHLETVGHGIDTFS